MSFYKISDSSFFPAINDPAQDQDCFFAVDSDHNDLFSTHLTDTFPNSSLDPLPNNHIVEQISNFDTTQPSTTIPALRYIPPSLAENCSSDSTAYFSSNDSSPSRHVTSMPTPPVMNKATIISPPQPHIFKHPAAAALVRMLDLYQTALIYENPFFHLDLNIRGIPEHAQKSFFHIQNVATSLIANPSNLPLLLALGELRSPKELNYINLRNSSISLCEGLSSDLLTFNAILARTLLVWDNHRKNEVPALLTKLINTVGNSIQQCNVFKQYLSQNFPFHKTAINLSLTNLTKIQNSLIKYHEANRLEKTSQTKKRSFEARKLEAPKDAKRVKKVKEIDEVKDVVELKNIAVNDATEEPRIAIDLTDQHQSV